MPVKLEIMDTGDMSVSKTPTSKKGKRKLQNGDAEELGLGQVAENEETNNNIKTPKLKKKKKTEEKPSPPETAEQCNGEQEELDAPTPKKVKKKKQKENKEEPETQQETPEARINGEENGKKKKSKAKKAVIAEEEIESTDEPAAKRLKSEHSQDSTIVESEQAEPSEEDEALKLEKLEGAFSKFPISEETISNLKVKGVSYLFPIQVKTFHTVYSGKDVVVQARTGTGKTFCFALPLIEKLKEDEQQLVRGRAPRVWMSLCVFTRGNEHEAAREDKEEARGRNKNKLELWLFCLPGTSLYRTQHFIYMAKLYKTTLGRIISSQMTAPLEDTGHRPNSISATRHINVNIINLPYHLLLYYIYLAFFFYFYFAFQVLILTPTRELAIQIMNEIRGSTKKLKVCCFYGGTPYQPQLFSIKDGFDILVGTPGRVKDLIQNHRLDLTLLKHVVLDEVDMMFDMGFAEQVEEILSARYKLDPKDNPQTLLFSATCPDWMYKVAKKYMQTVYEKIDLVGHRSQRAAITVEHLAIECTRSQKANILGDIVQVYSGSHGKTIIFCDSKLEAHELSTNCGSIKQSAKALHGDLQQKEREVILKGFRQGSFEVLIATNVAARGLDIPEVDLVVLYSAPKEADSYVHRSGRTGRAGRTGVCISLCEPWERHYLRTVERSTGITFKRVGIPSTLNVAKSSSADAIKSLDSIPADVIEHFKAYAEELIEKKGALTALAAALAHICGAKSIIQRSLLNMESGYTTMMLKSSVTIHSMSYAWKSIKEQLGEEVDSKISRMCMLKDSTGVCFDVKTDILQSIQDNWTDTRRWQLTVATELPELQESKRDMEGPNNRRFGGRGRRPFDRRNNSSQRGGGRRNFNGGSRRGR